MQYFKKWGSDLYLSLIIGFLYLPIVYLAIFAFNDSRSLTKFSRFSFRWFERVYGDEKIIEIIILTLALGIISTIVSTVVGTLLAISLSHTHQYLRKAIIEVNNLPMLNPDIVTAVSLLIFFVTIQLERGFVTLLLTHIMFSIPYVTLTVMPKLRTLNENTIEAALDLGASYWQAITKVLLPQLKTAIFSGALIAFAMSIDDFVISYFVSGKVSNVSILVYSMGKRINPSVNVLSTSIVGIVLMLLVFINLLDIFYHQKSKEHAT